jgi:myo-inositol 2-dehydrogenase/D-chiro-inositol 1-dehydrogenase
MADDQIQIGFIGSGYIAGQHAAALQSLDGVAFSACADLDIDRAEALAQLTGCRPTTDVQEVIEASDAVWVCTPPKAHRDQVVACLEAGKHVYCEKPLATSVEEGQAAVAAAEASAALAAIGFNFRFHEPWRKCKELIDSGDLGDPVMFVCQRFGLGATSGWRRDPEQLCGMTIESLSHNVDLMRFLLGDVASVSAQTAAADGHQPEFDNCLVATLTLKSGVIAGIQATWASSVPATRDGVVGTTATALIEGPSQFEFTDLRVSAREEGGAAERVHHFALPSNPLQPAGEHFVQAIRGETPLEIPIGDGLRSLEVCAAMVASARSGGAIVAV